MTCGAVGPWGALRTTALKGDRLGFVDRDGELFAKVGGKRVRLGLPPASARYVGWAIAEHRLGHSKRPLQFVGQALAATGQAIVLGALLGTALVLKLTEDGDCEHDYDYDCD